MHVHFSELSLVELLDDPLVQLLMASDGVKDAPNETRRRRQPREPRR